MPEKKMVKVGSKHYRVLAIGDMDRATVKRFRALTNEVKEAEERQEGEDLLWEVAALLVPGAPQDAVDKLTVTECARLIGETGAFTGDFQGITLGESSASTDS